MSKNNKDAVHPVSGLKIRRQTADEVKIVNKPRKMNLVKPTRLPEKSGDFANSSLLVFPTDRLGITREIKQAMIRATSRIGTDPANMELIGKTLDILAKHMQARFDQNKAVQPLKKRVDNSTEVSADTLEDDDSQPEDVSYADMVATLKELGIKPDSRSKDDVTKAYNDRLPQGDE